MSILGNKTTKVICEGIIRMYLQSSSSVIPAKAGVPLRTYDRQKRDPSFRWGDIVGVP